MELLGLEVKALRAGQASLDGSYVVIKNGEAWLVGAFIPPYQAGNAGDYDPHRERKLLLTKEELATLSDLSRGLTIVPISVYNKGHKLKLEIGTARGKKKFDKRETLKKRTIDREIRREHSDR